MSEAECEGPWEQYTPVSVQDLHNKYTGAQSFKIKVA